MYYDSNTVAYLNGQFIKAEDARADLYSQTLHYGIGVFEGIRSYKTQMGPEVFKAEQHFDRLLYSAAKIGIEIRKSKEELIQATYQLLKKNRLENAYIRPLVFSDPDMSFRRKPKGNIFIACWQWGGLLGEELLDVKISSFEKPSPKTTIIDAKIVGHYVNSSLATKEAEKNGYQAALLLDYKGFIAQGAAGNFFYEKDGIIYTPKSDNIFPGITRATILDLAALSNINVEEKDIKPADLEFADAAFFTGTAAEVAGIKRIDNYKMKMVWEDSLSYEISCKYQQMVRDQEYHESTVI